MLPEHLGNRWRRKERWRALPESARSSLTKTPESYGCSNNTFQVFVSHNIRKIENDHLNKTTNHVCIYIPMIKFSMRCSFQRKFAATRWMHTSVQCDRAWWRVTNAPRPQQTCGQPRFRQAYTGRHDYSSKHQTHQPRGDNDACARATKRNPRHTKHRKELVAA